MQSPSSLIFLVLLGVWAAYFVQYWVRRRDHVATARSVEEFSEAMRVLERRDPLPRTDLSEQAPRSYAVHPARANRPQVMVKRAVAAESARPLTVTARVTGRGEAVPAPGAAAARPVASGSTAARPAGSGATATGPAGPRLRPSRRVRGLLVLAALLELLVVVPLVGFSVLPVWALAAAVVAVVAAGAFLRSGVRAEQAVARARRRRRADLARSRSAAPVTAQAGRRAAVRAVPARAVPARAVPASTAPAATAAPGRVTASAAAGATDAAPPTDTQPVSADAPRSPLDVALDVAPAAPAPGPVVESTVVTPAAGAQPPSRADSMVPIVDDDDMPVTWDPVPVPRPTYTMKAKAERPEVAPAAVTPDAAPVERPDVAEETAYPERRFAGA